MNHKIVLNVLTIYFIKVKCWKLELSNPHPAFDPELYSSVLEPVTCRRQLHYIRNNALLAFMFADASAKFPTGLLSGNRMALGAYHQCLAIHHGADGREPIQGKYCIISIDTLDIIDVVYRDTHYVERSKPKMSSSLIEELAYTYIVAKGTQELTSMKENRNTVNGTNNRNISTRSLLERVREAGVPLPATLGVCVPRACSTHQVLNRSLAAVPVTEHYCRLPRDKRWAPADTAATIVFSIIGILNIICTAYNVVYKFILKKDAACRYLETFNAYQNAYRLANVDRAESMGRARGALPCLDGVRVLAMLWILLGHAFVLQWNYLNLTDILAWYESTSSWHITSAQFSVDSFFALSGLLLVYSMRPKIHGKPLLQWLGQIYVRRLTRLFPLLGTAVLMQASPAHRLVDGPLWGPVARATDACRTYWLFTLLHLQNIIPLKNMCLFHSWYLAIDVQLHLVSSLVLWGVARGGRTAQIALAAGVLASLVATASFTFHYGFLLNVAPHPRVLMKLPQYMRMYYTNVVTRAPPFFVGMVYGYVLDAHRAARLRISAWCVVAGWCCTGGVLAAVLASTHYSLQEHWDHPLADKLLNTGTRAAWATALGWVVMACTHGYGGPVGWALSLRVWRVPARLCYGVYLFHLPLMLMVAGTGATLDHFSSFRLTFMFVGYASTSFLISYVANVLINVPLAIVFDRIIPRSLQPAGMKMKEPEQIIERL